MTVPTCTTLAVHLAQRNGADMIISDFYQMQASSLDICWQIHKLYAAIIGFIGAVVGSMLYIVHGSKYSNYYWWAYIQMHVCTHMKKWYNGYFILLMTTLQECTGLLSKSSWCINKK